MTQTPEAKRHRGACLTATCPNGGNPRVSFVTERK